MYMESQGKQHFFNQQEMTALFNRNEEELKNILDVKEIYNKFFKEV